MEKTQVVVIGGGATGTGILRDLAMRGIEAILVEQYDLAHGTSSRFHGLLHSGARYAVNDPESARECIEENTILRQVAKTCVEETEGFFVQLPQDPDEYVQKWLTACEKVGIPVREITVAEALKLESNINPQAVRVFVVPDAAIDGFRLTWGNVTSAEEYGARAYTYTKVDKIIIEKGQVAGVKVTDLKKDSQRIIECDYVINATGAWASEIAALAGVKLEVICDKGTLLAFNHRISTRVINRLRQPGDGDIMVPHGTVAIFGTTSIKVDDPNCLSSTSRETKALMELGRDLFPKIDEFRVLRSFAGVRPLYKEPDEAGAADNSSAIDSGRAVTRGFALLDHHRDGVTGLISVVGGKLTTYRLMAEKAVNLICKKMNNTTPCKTAQQPIIEPANEQQIAALKELLSTVATAKLTQRLGGKVDEVMEIIKKAPWKSQIICHCEQVSLAEIELRLTQRRAVTLNDLRRQTRMGMGTCQGSVCATSAIGMLFEKGMLTFEQVEYLMKDFLEERWKGNHLTLWGDQLRQADLTRHKYLNLINLTKGDEQYEI